VSILQPEFRAANLWRKRRSRKKNVEEDKPLFDWTLDELIQVAVKMEWLPVTGGALSVAEPIDKLAGEVGDAVRFIQEVRNLVVHLGKYLRGDYWPTIGRIEYDIVTGLRGQCWITFMKKSRSLMLHRCRAACVDLPIGEPTA
jgi:hypothetical protein